MKRLKLANNDKLFNGNELKEELLKYIFDNMQYDGNFEADEGEKQTYDYPGSAPTLECYALGTIDWKTIESQFGPITDEEKKQILIQLNEDGGDAYNYVEKILNDFTETGFNISGIDYSFKNLHNTTLMLDSKVADWDIQTPDKYDYADDDYMDKMTTREHDDERYW